MELHLYFRDYEATFHKFTWDEWNSSWYPPTDVVPDTAYKTPIKYLNNPNDKDWGPSTIVYTEKQVYNRVRVYE